MKRMTLWHPTESGRIVQADVAWPRSWWIKDAINGLPRSTATLAEVADFEQRIEVDQDAERAARIEALAADRPTESSPWIEHARYIQALGDEFKMDAYGGGFTITTRHHALYVEAVDTAKRVRDRMRPA